jgi:iron complex transport system ATP-binding protein
MKPAVLEIKDLSCGYSHKTILHDIRFSVEPGEVISVIGPNGSGKTTLINAITKVISSEKGTVLIDGSDITKMPPKALARKTAVVAQYVDPVAMTVEEYILLGRLPYFKKYQFFETKKDRALARHYMDLTETSKFKEALLCEISGGERQLASIARALVQEPILLLLDEPTSHLDITHQIKVLDLISSMNRKLGLTVLMVLHDLNLAGEYSDKLVMLNGKEGRIHSVGTPSQVLTAETIKDVYGTDVMIEKNPVSKKPWVFLVSKKGKSQGKK